MQEPTNPGMHGTKQMNHGAIFVYVLYCQHPHLPILWLWTHGCAFAADDFPRSWSLQHLQVFGLTNSTSIFIKHCVIEEHQWTAWAKRASLELFFKLSRKHFACSLCLKDVKTCLSSFPHTLNKNDHLEGSQRIIGFDSAVKWHWHRVYIGNPSIQISLCACIIMHLSAIDVSVYPTCLFTGCRVSMVSTVPIYNESIM